LVTALNPKGIVFFVAFLPQFTARGGNMTFQLLILAATFVCMAIINATLYAVFAAKTRRLLVSPRAQRGFNAVGGSLLCAAGVWALLARRAV
jgi:threonine/homoserine/homoserine lactone efflux protein